MFPELRVGDDRNGPLQHIVSELMGHKLLYDLVHTKLAAPGLGPELPRKHLIVPIVRALEDLVDLVGSLGRIKALLYDIRGEFKLAEAHKVPRDEVQDLFIAQVVLEFENVLHQVVAEGVLDQHMDAGNDHRS